jgi:hypothetical protein
MRKQDFETCLFDYRATDLMSDMDGEARNQRRIARYGPVIICNLFPKGSLSVSPFGDTMSVYSFDFVSKQVNGVDKIYFGRFFMAYITNAMRANISDTEF